VNFDEVHKLVPYETQGRLHSNSLNVYTDVRVKYPGRHALDTDPIGGDYVVEALCDVAEWDWKQFTHTDIFKDVQLKTDANSEWMQSVGIKQLADVVSGSEIPHPLDVPENLPGVRWSVLLRASQCLAVAEHRRYHRYEAGGGGRFLPLRFAVGIVYGHWNESDASRVQRRGIHGYRELTKEFGSPPTVKALLTPAEVV
jgi:hypothetical protein